MLGRSFDGDLLSTETSDDLEGLEELRRRGVLEEDRAGRLRFSHDKLREIAYESIAEAERRNLHARAVHRIQARTDASAPSWFATLAHHYTAAQMDDKAFEYLEKAASHALRLGAHRTTVDTLRRAFDLAALRGHAAGSLVGDARRARWHSALGEAWFCLGDLTKAREHLQIALEGVGVRLPGTQREWALTVLKQAAFQILQATRRAPPPVPEDERERVLAGARSASKLCEYHYYRQDMLAVTGSALLAVNLAERAGRRSEVRRQYAQLGYMAGLFRAHPLARRYLRQAHAPGLDDAAGERGTALYYASSYEATFCRWEEAERLADLAIAELIAVHNLHELQIARTMRAHIHYWRGELAAALPLFEAVRRDAGAAANAQLQAWGAYASARSLVALGRVEEAVLLLREALRLLEGQADRSSHIICRGLLAEALVRLGDLHGARAEADAVLTLAEGGRPAALTEGSGYAGAADAYLELWERAAARGGPVEELAERARRACTVLDGFGAMFPLAGPAARRCRARMLALRGHGFRARRARQGALVLARELRMPYEEALIELDLGRTAGARTARGRAHLRRSIEIFARLDCRARAAEVGTLLE